MTQAARQQVAVAGRIAEREQVSLGQRKRALQVTPLVRGVERRGGDRERQTEAGRHDCEDAFGSQRPQQRASRGLRRAARLSHSDGRPDAAHPVLDFPR